MKIDRDSWHWKIIRFSNDPWIEDKIGESCRYFRILFLSIIKTGISFSIIAWLGVCILLGLFHLFGAVFGYLESPDPNLVTVGVVSITVPLMIYLTFLYSKRQRFPDIPAKRGFVSQWYDRVKNKYCSKIEFMD